MAHRPAFPARGVRRLFRAIGLHPEDPREPVMVRGGRALVVATNHGWLDIGRPTGVFASELTVAYYHFLDAGMEVDVASPSGGLIPVDPLSRMAVIRTPSDDRFLGDPVLRAKVTDSTAVGDLDITAYDIVYLAGGWGAAYDFGFSEPLAAAMSQADAAGAIIGGVCHGPLGLINATTPDGRPLPRGPTGHRRVQPADPRVADHLDPATSRGRAPRPAVAVRVTPGPVGRAGQPLGGRRQPGDWAEPERRTDGGAGDAGAGPATPRRSYDPTLLRTSRTGKPLGGGVGAGAMLGEAAAHLRDRGGEGEDVPGDELVVVVGRDGVPIDAVGGDGDLGNQ